MTIICDSTKKLCKNLNCNICFIKSFASIYFSNNIVDKKINLRMLSKNSNKIYEFYCNICNHKFIKKISDVTRKGQECPYCANPSNILCKNNDCERCYNKSFESHEKSIFWDYTKNDKIPREVFKNSGLKYFFKCKICDHSFDIKLLCINQFNQFCSYCSNQKLCTDKSCDFCLNKSFILHPMAKKFSEKNNINCRYIFLKTNKKYLFNCDKCNHEFLSRIADLKEDKLNCPYCAKKILCDNNNCNICFNNSFASHKRSICWSNKNIEETRNIFKSCNKKFIFDCIDCKNEFIVSPNLINTHNQWCPICTYKTEKKLHEWLSTKYHNIQYQYIIKNNDNTYKYDFYIKDFNILIELDGDQHFKQVSNWASPEYNLNNDINKIMCSIKNNYTIIHLLQTNVLHDLNNWEDKLINNIKIYEEPQIIFINNNENIYKKHLNELTEINL